MKTSIFPTFSSFKRAASCLASDKIRGLKVTGNGMTQTSLPHSLPWKHSFTGILKKHLQCNRYYSHLLIWLGTYFISLSNVHVATLESVPHFTEVKNDKVKCIILYWSGTTDRDRDKQLCTWGKGMKQTPREQLFYIHNRQLNHICWSLDQNKRQ